MTLQGAIEDIKNFQIPFYQEPSRKKVIETIVETYQQGRADERNRIVRELKELKEDLANYSEDDIFLGEYRAYEKAIEIVRGGENE